ncbi:MAG: gene transfer agent family protein [Shimia sp.]
MANPYAGEVALVVDGRRHVCKLTLGALAELEASLGDEALPDLVARFEAGRYGAADILALLVAGLRGGGWQGTRDDLLTAEIEGGTVGAARTAARLLVGAFQPFGTA